MKKTPFLLLPLVIFSLSQTSWAQGDAPTPPVLRTANPKISNVQQSAPAPPVLRQAKQAEEAQNNTSPDEVEESDVVRVSTSLITVPAQVLDRNGRYVGNLHKEDFQIFENGVPQQVSYFGSIEQPFTVALLLDVSGSTVSQMQAIRSAANAFITRLRPNDQLLILSFDGKINVLTEAIKVSELRRRQLRLDALNDGTVLYDAVDAALNQRLKNISGRKAIVLLTDGVDQGSRRSSRRQNLRDAEESDVLIYTVQYNTLPQLPERLARISDPKARARFQSRMEKEYAAGSVYLRTLAEKTGGRLYNAEALTDIQHSFTSITDELGRQYSLGYYPKGTVKPGETRDIRVRIRIPNLVVRARDSYVANGVSNRQME